MFANVDLEVVSRRDLDPLLEELSPKMFLLHETRERGRHFVSLELLEQRYRTPETCIARFATLLERLSPGARRLWTAAVQRRFDVGVVAPAAYPAFVAAVTPATLARAAALGATIALTVYPPGAPGAPGAQEAPRRGRKS